MPAKIGVTHAQRRTKAVRREEVRAVVAGLLSDMLSAFKEIYGVTPPLSSLSTGHGGTREFAVALSGVAAAHAGLFLLMKRLQVEPTEEQREGGRHIESLLREIERPAHTKSANAPMISDHEARVRAMTNAANARIPELGLLSEANRKSKEHRES